MNKNIKKLTDVISDIVTENEEISYRLHEIESNSVIIDKIKAKTLVEDFDYIMENVRKAASGSFVDWEAIVCELGFGVYSVVAEIKKQC
jgi:hypothetical protein